MKKLIALILCALMLVGILAACDNGNETVSPTPTPVSPTNVSDEPDDQEPDDSAELSLPIVDEKVTYTVWNGPISVTAGMETPNDSTAYQKAEELTNIHIEWMQPTSGQEQEQFNLIMVSQNLPDMFFSGNAFGPACYYIGGYDKYIDDGLIIDLSDLIEAYAPNYDALRNVDETVRRNTMTDSGNVPYFRTISEEREPTWVGVWARQDWLDQSGTGIVANNVNTYGEFHDMLAALKDYSGIAPYYLWTNKTGIEEVLMAGYGVLTGYVNRGGTAVFGPTDPGYRDYLEMMSEWFAEGLIDPEFFARDGVFADMAMMINGDFGAFQFFYSSGMIEDQIPADVGADLQGVKPPVKNAGDIRKLTYNNVPHTVLGGGNATITTNSDDVVPLVKWMDFFYSEEGALLGNWGINGEAHVVGPDGEPQWTELIFANPDGLNSGEAQGLYSIGPIHPKLYDWIRGFSPTMPEKNLKVGTDVWDRDYVETETMPEIAISVEESAEYSTLMSDIKTFVEENTLKLILG